MSADRDPDAAPDASDLVRASTPAATAAVRRRIERFDCCDHSELKDLLQEVCEVVSDGHGRIEITACDQKHRCVIISKEELETLEHALAILSETAVARSAHARVARLCTSVEQSDGTVATSVDVVAGRKFNDA